MRNAIAYAGTLLILAAAGTGAAGPLQQPAPPAPPPAAPSPQPAAQQPAQKPRPAQAGRGSAAGLTLAVQATDMSGNPIADVSVAADGPVARSAPTGADGGVLFRSLRPGTYRLRFEREGFTTLEREVVLRAGQPGSVSVALNAGPPAPPPPAAEPAPPEPAPVTPPRTARVVEPRSLSLPDFLDKNLIGGEPQRTTLLACAEGGSGRLLQVRDPLTDQEHADADEILYVVAGRGTIRVSAQNVTAEPGYFVLVPRGVPHSIRREGRNPIILLSVLAGPPCMGEEEK